MNSLFTSSTADISDCGQYRYDLQRRWADGPLLTFIMLNPSTADADTDDPTIKRCARFAHREGLAGVRVVNLFAFRTADPRELIGASSPVGPRNRYVVLDALLDARDADALAIAAWGTWRHPACRPIDVPFLAHCYDVHLHCLGRTKHGDPRHPLYVRADQPFEVWP